MVVARFAYGGRWYRRHQCQDCHGYADEYERDVDQSNKADCCEANMSQGLGWQE